MRTKNTAHPYTSIESAFIRWLISWTSWKDRHYIGHIVLIFQYLSGRRIGFFATLLIPMLMKEYDEETAVLKCELRRKDEAWRKKHPFWSAIRAYLARRRDTVSDRRNIKDDESHADWLKAGGRP